MVLLLAPRRSLWRWHSDPPPVAQLPDLRYVDPTCSSDHHQSVVVADVELVTDWGGSGEGRAAGRISASTAHCTCASICVALMAASLWCFFNFARTPPTMSLLPFFALNQALPHRFPCPWTPVSIPAASAALHDRVCISAACRAWVLRRST
jgi:hypothetical protein